MMDHAGDNLEELLAAAVEGPLSDDQQHRLDKLLAGNPESQDLYARYMALHAWLTWDRPAGELALADDTAAGTKPARPARARSISASFRTAAQVIWHPISLLVLVGLISAGMLAYKFAAKPGAHPVANQRPTVPAGPVATLAGASGAQWKDSFLSDGQSLAKGKRLVLQKGSAEIKFGDQARVILEAPAELTIVDAGACRLETGKLTASCPQAARGFKVHTPEGTVTDLGTEFGVYVKSEVRSDKAEVEEQKESEQLEEAVTLLPITEVHVFKGKVDITTAQLSITPESKIQNPKSKIVSAGQAVTISQQKVQPLPAADPFKFALDKLQGRPRTVLLSEDFEKYDVGVKQGSMGDWIIQGSTRKRQAVGIDDYDKALADWTAQGTTDPSLKPAPPSISRVLTLAPSEPNPRDTFPKVARPIEAPQLAHRCQVLVEFVLFPSGNIEPSFAFAPEAGLAPGIEFWRNADPAAQPIQWKPPLVYRVRVLMDVVDGKPREARVERSQWSGSAGWVRDADFKSPVPTVDWTTPPKFVIFGYPTVTPQTPAGHFHIDNIRIEVIAEK